MKHSIKWLTQSSLIAALYVTLTGLSSLFGLSSGIVQVRLSELLCVLPVLTPAAIPGVTIGCLISNLIFGGTIFDILIGTLATLIGAIGAYYLRKSPILASIPTIFSNAILIPVVLILSGIGTWSQFLLYALMIAIGEILACGIIGTFVLFKLSKIITNQKKKKDSDTLSKSK